MRRRHLHARATPPLPVAAPAALRRSARDQPLPVLLPVCCSACSWPSPSRAPFWPSPSPTAVLLIACRSVSSRLAVASTRVAAAALGRHRGDQHRLEPLAVNHYFAYDGYIVYNYFVYVGYFLYIATSHVSKSSVPTTTTTLVFFFQDSCSIPGN
ncbi:uncharacterized protein LOC112270802 isoform X1 [Brachypodium distachyon]|uniref:uncharacterized protein LOC112270802 isoform X1 n=1 Tax=Brachypodium distachyon TaxID=15368 RepID=UPI000D0D658A|nr:uncharacterized protein LOC112270802 isoform X1 [Brachypodium distachyon]|eukprot:XP_024314816.1 uncharacterized protein LOC112270802 isoform X1 [Brachypodium distachyon]